MIIADYCRGSPPCDESVGTLFRRWLLDVAEECDSDSVSCGLCCGCIDSDLDASVCQRLDKCLVVILCEAVVPNGGLHRKLHIVESRIVAGDHAQRLDLSLVLIPLAVLDGGEQSVDGCAKTLHCAGDGHAFAVLAVYESLLVDVDADELAAFFAGCFSCGSVDTAAACEDDLCAALVPCVHSCCDISVAVELVAVRVVDRYVWEPHFLSCVVVACHEAVAVTDNCANSHAAEEA